MTDDDGGAVMSAVVREIAYGVCDAQGWYGGADYDTARARALYAALGVEPCDDDYALAAHADGRWALIGLTVEGHRFAVEAD